MIKDIENWAREEAERFGCVLSADYPRVIQEGQLTDAIEICMETRGINGPMYGATIVDINRIAAALPDDASDDDVHLATERITRKDVRAMAAMVRSQAMLPQDVPVMHIGCSCPIHKSARITSVSWSGWTFGCTEQDIHPLPDRIAQWHEDIGHHLITRSPAT